MARKNWYRLTIEIWQARLTCIWHTFPPQRCTDATAQCKHVSETAQDSSWIFALYGSNLVCMHTLSETVHVYVQGMAESLVNVGRGLGPTSIHMWPLWPHRAKWFTWVIYWKCAICRIILWHKGIVQIAHFLWCRLHTITVMYIHPSGPFCSVRSHISKHSLLW